jgi:phosphopantetheine adenylyltransferase
MCDDLIIGVAVNPEKKCMFNTAERVDLVERMTTAVRVLHGRTWFLRCMNACVFVCLPAQLPRGRARVRVVSFSGLVVDYAKECNGACCAATAAAATAAATAYSARPVLYPAQ